MEVGTIITITLTKEDIETILAGGTVDYGDYKVMGDLIGDGNYTLATVTPKYSGRWHGREVEGLPMGHGANL